MFIRYQHVKKVVLGVVGLFLFSCTCGLCFCGGDEKPASNLITSSPQYAQPQTSKRTSQAPVRRRGGVQDKALIAVANGRAPSHGKKKDALSKSAVKINLYEDSGDSHFDRAKVDRDRDGSWDEKWSWKDGRWSRDGRGDVWKNNEWVSKKSSGKSSTKRSEGSKAGEGGLNAAQKKLRETLLRGKASKKKIKDLLGGKGAKINVYDDDKDGKWDRAKVDTTRDGKWDEKWTVKSGRVERKVEATGKVFLWVDGVWKLK